MTYKSSQDSSTFNVSDGELSIEMCVDDGVGYSFSSFTGTREQLEAEGLVPFDVKWIPGTNWTSWNVGEITYLLRQYSPTKAKKGECNLWTVRMRGYPRVPLEQVEAVRLQRRLIEIEQAQIRGTHHLERQQKLIAISKNDKAFQVFKRTLLGLVRTRRSRSAKSKESNRD